MARKSRKVKQQRFSFTDSLYKTALVIVIGGDRNAYLRRMKVKPEFIERSGINIVEGMYYRIRQADNTAGHNYSLIWLKELSVPHLVHELFHFVTNVFRNNGIEDEEAFAYYMEYWLTKIGRKIQWPHIQSRN